jgi:hypothetical protein
MELEAMGPVFVGVEMASSLQAVAVVACGEVAGRQLVNLLAEVAADAAVGYLQALTGRPLVLGLVVDPRAESSALARDLAAAGVLVTEADAGTVAAATGRFLTALAAGTLRHLDQAPLSKAIRAAQPHGGSLVNMLAFGRRRAADLSPLVAAALAHSAYLDHGAGAQPGAWVI